MRAVPSACCICRAFIIRVFIFCVSGFATFFLHPSFVFFGFSNTVNFVTDAAQIFFCLILSVGDDLGDYLPPLRTLQTQFNLISFSISVLPWARTFCVYDTYDTWDSYTMPKAFATGWIIIFLKHHPLSLFIPVEYKIWNLWIISLC